VNLGLLFIDRKNNLYVIMLRELRNNPLKNEVKVIWSLNLFNKNIQEILKTNFSNTILLFTNKERVLSYN
jgi:hypothetical protein